MSIFPKKLSTKPKKLSLDEMWNLHNIYSSKEPKSLKTVVNILYPKRTKQLHGTELIQLSIIGLYKSGYTEFLDLVKRFSNGN